MRLQGAIIVTATLLATPVLSQDEGDNPGISLDLETRLTGGNELAADPNGELAKSVLTQQVDFGYASETRSETLSFGVGGKFGCSDVSGCYGLSSQDAQLSYIRSASRSALDLQADHRQSRLFFGTILPEDGDIFDPDALTAETGTLARTNLNAEFIGGVDAPFGITLSADTQIVRYQDTDLASLSDRETFGLDADLRFDVSPALSARLLAGLSNYEADDADATERRGYSLGVGLTARLDGTTQIGATLSATRLEISEGIGAARDTRTTDGTTLSFDAKRDTSSGTLNANLLFVSGDPFQRSRLTFGRVIGRPAGTLSFAFGISETADGATPIGNIGWTQELPRGDISVSASRSLRVADDEDDLSLTRGDFRHGYQINSVTQLDLLAQIAQIEDLSVGGDTTYRASLELSVSRDITSNWAIAVGVDAQVSGGDSTETEQSNSAFVALRRTLN